MGIRGVLLDLDGLDRAAVDPAVLDEVRRWWPIGLLVPTGPVDPPPTIDPPLLDAASFVLEIGRVGLPDGDLRLLTMGAAGFACHPNEIVVVGADPDGWIRLAPRVGGHGIWVNPGGAVRPRGLHPAAEITSLDELVAALERLDGDLHDAAGHVGAPPHPEPRPTGDHLDPELLDGGDRRNVVDRYRYWREDAIAADLRRRARPFHVAVENWRRDRNIGTVVRNANGFGAAAVHIVGPRRWNRRGAMATDRYLDVTQHETTAAFVERVRSEGLAIVAVDNVEGSVPIETAELPERCVLVFGQEGPGVTRELLDAADLIVAITQSGSTRSLNAGVAAGIAMYAWTRHHTEP